MQVIQGDDNSQDSDSNIYTSSIYCWRYEGRRGGGGGGISFLGINQYCEGYSVSSLNCGNSTLVERVAVVVLLVMVLAVVLVVVVVLVLVAVVVMVLLPTTTT